MTYNDGYEEYDVDDQKEVRYKPRNLLAEFERDMQARRVTVLALYHTYDIPLPIVEMIQRKANM
jgi:hypothetical protein